MHRDALDRYRNGKKLSGVINERHEKLQASTLKKVVIVTNMWDQVSKEVGEVREAELKTEMFFRVTSALVRPECDWMYLQRERQGRRSGN